jgi:TatD family-associated radical SAM protein
VFCNKDELQEYVKYNLILKKEPDEKEIINELKKRDLHKYKELVFCGIGEPTLRLNVILGVLKWIKANSNIKTRMNTNGHAYLIHKNRKAAKELKNAGLDTINISLNALNEKYYEKVCRPKNKGAYKQIVKFVEDCRDIGIDTLISFVDTYIDTKKAKELAKKLGVKIKIRKNI